MSNLPPTVKKFAVYAWAAVFFSGLFWIIFFWDGSFGWNFKGLVINDVMRTTLSVLVLDIILMPPLLIITVAANLLWIVSAASKFGRFAMPFIYVAVFVLASSFGYWFISSAQEPKERATTYHDGGDTREDCERHPGVYGC